MISNKKLKKVLISIIAVILLFLLPFLATKIIYDNIFKRYDCQNITLSDELENIVLTRKNFNYKCKNNDLTGFLYECQKDKKDTLIVLAPGYNACCDSYLWQIKELLGYGWSVFSFDTTGSCHSEGNSAVGFSQEILDLNATLDFIESNNRFNYKNIALFGHSRGGYAVCCSLASDYDISAIISVSGINSAMEGVVGASCKHIGNIAYANYGFLWLYQSIIFGKDIVDMKADEILSSTDTPALIIHGANDSNVPIDKFSIISHKEKIKNKNVEYFVCANPKNSGHTDLLFEQDGTADNTLIEKINDFLNKSIKQKGLE
ncbi:MAG: alpha/beta hydrolase [Clostridia bacterium]|nr:alpha/beta hydrolase [Clostridia bacterium]